MDVGKRITELREQKGFTTNKLANLAGVSQSYLREVELGKKNPTIEMLSYICYGLGITVESFFTVESGSINSFLLSALSDLSESEQNKLAEFIIEIKKVRDSK